MKYSKNKTVTTIIVLALSLMLTITGTLVTIPFANAQTAASPIPTHAYITVSPNPVGVGQHVTIQMWLVEFDPRANTYLGKTFENFTVLITKPDGTTQTLGPFTAFDNSFANTIYAPDKVGNYTAKFTFPGNHVIGTTSTGAPVDSYYGASSYTTTFTVQDEPVSTTPQVPLPTNYWQHPINAQNQYWYTLSGGWLSLASGGLTRLRTMNGNFNPYTTVPNSAHIVWTKPLEAGGLIGGKFGSDGATNNYYNGKSYEPCFDGVVIINGVLYYKSPVTPRMGFYAVDLRTGQTLWYQNNTFGITNGQIYNYYSPNQEGAIPYLWYVSGSTWYMYDANTGNLVAIIANATGGSNFVEGPSGELLMYVISANGWLAMWNSSKCLLSRSTNVWQWRPYSGTTTGQSFSVTPYDWNRGVEWNVTIKAYPGETINVRGNGMIDLDDGVIVAVARPTAISPWQMEQGFSSDTGAQLWVQNRTVPFNNNWGLMGAIADGVYTEFDSGTMTWSGYSVFTGERVWGPSTAYSNPFDSLANDDVFAQSAYGILYHQTIAGIHAHNMTTGESLWDFYSESSGADFPGLTTYPFETNNLYTVADGKVIAGTGNSHGAPLYRGTSLYVLDAYTGQKVWSINGYYQGTMPVDDGYLLAFNAYDNQLYCFNKGQTATTVTTEPSINNAAQILIKGTVTDQSPGLTCLGIPAAGTPAISDASMSDWMEYLFMQQPKPNNATGVPVTLSYIDPNNNVYTIGTTTSDMNGQYSYTFTPDVPGTYKIIATFDATDSYYSSSAQTLISFEQPATTTQPTTSLQQSAADLYFIPAIAGLFIFVAIIGAVLIVLLLRKRP
jgi:hypothetical protein